MGDYVRRHRSSTAASNSPPHGPEVTKLQDLLERLSDAAREQKVNFQPASLPKISDILRELRPLLASSSYSLRLKDAFRHGRGLEILLEVLELIPKSESGGNGSIEAHDYTLELLKASLDILAEAFQEHRGNRRYFTGRVRGNGWHALETIIKSSNISVWQLAGSNHLVSQSHLFGCLFGFALGDEELVVAFKGSKALLQSETDATNGVKTNAPSSPTKKGNWSDRPHLSDETDALHLQTRVRERMMRIFKGGDILQNPEILPLIFNLWSRIPRGQSNGAAETQLLSGFILSTFVHLAESSAFNLAAMHGAGTLSQVLRALVESKFSANEQTLLDALAKRQASLGINTLEDAHYLYQWACQSDRAADFLCTALEVSSGPPYIQFDLSLHGYSSAELPSMGQSFPPLSSSSGYTFTVWIRIDKFDTSCHTTIFGAFDASQTCFVLGYLEKDSHQFILQTSVTSPRPSVRFRNVSFEEGKWYHLALIHRRPKATSSSRATLLVDGDFVEQVKINYPQSPSQVTSAADSKSLEASRKSLRIQAFLGTPQDLAARVGRNVVSTKWSLASAHLFSEAISEELVTAYQKLGPRYNGNFQDCLGSFQTYRASAEVNLYNESLHPGKEENSDIIRAMRFKASSILDESRIIFSISPNNVLDDDDRNNVDESQLIKSLSKPAAKSLQYYTRSGSNAVVINAAVPAINDALTHTHGVAILTGEPVVAIPQPLDEASWRLAGSVSVGLRLLQMADSSKSVLRAVRIIFASVDHDWRNSEAMEKEHGFGILACLLRDKLGLASATTVTTFGKADPIDIPNNERDDFTKELLKIILKFVGVEEEKPEDSLLVNALAFRVLLVDFDTWRRAGPQTQILYYSVFGTLINGSKHHNFNARRLARMRIMKRFLDALKGEQFSQQTLPHFMGAFRILMKSTQSPDTWRSLALFVTFALQDDRAFRNTSLRSRGTLRVKSAQLSSSPNGKLSPNNATARAASPQPSVSRSDLALNVLEVIADMVCDKTSISTAVKFARTVTVRWALHLLAESNPRAIVLVVKIIARLLFTHGASYVRKFDEKSGGFIILKHRLRAWWNIPALWTICFAVLFGFDVAFVDFERDFDLYNLMDTFNSRGKVAVKYPEVLPVITSMLEQGLRTVVKQEGEGTTTPPENPNSIPTTPPESDTTGQRKRRSMSLIGDLTSIGKRSPRERVSSYGEVLNTAIRFLADLHAQSQTFNDFTISSTYVQDLLFVLYPVVVGSDNVSANDELQSKHSVLNFDGQDVAIRSHSRNALQPSPIVRTSVIEPPPSPTHPRADPLKRGSSFILVTSESGKYSPSSARLNPVMSPEKGKSVLLNIGNSIVEGLVEVVVAVFKDQIFERKEFSGFGLFLKVPPGFQEHQAYFESYVLLHTMRDLSNAIQLEQKQLLEPRVINNLARYCVHMGEAVYEGWFMNGAEPLLDFTGNLVDYLQRPDIAQVKSVRLCSQAVPTIRSVFLRVALLRLSELQDSETDSDSVDFLNKLTYWQTTLLGPENGETHFLRLICYLLYTKLVSAHSRVRLAAADLWRMLLVQKPSETSFILNHAFAAEQTSLTTGFLKLMEVDNETFIYWVDDHREELDALFFGAMSKIWEAFVTDENKKTEETARNRLSKRREKLKQWAAEESVVDNVSHRHENATSHWRVNIHSAERMKHQRALQDEQDNVNYLASCYDKLERLLRKPCGLTEDDHPTRWQLDESEGRNRMRMRVTPAKGIQQDDYQPKRKVSEKAKMNKLKLDTAVTKPAFDAINATPAPTHATTSERPDFNRLRSESGSKEPDIPEEDFEIVEEPPEDADGFEDKNRKVLRSLQRGDEVQNLSNVARIVGLEPVEGLLIVGKDSLYLMDDFFQRADGEVISVSQASAEERDPYLQMIAGREMKTRKPESGTGELSIRHWRWEEAISISKRRFLFRDVGIEIFFADGRSYLLTAPSPAVRNDLHSKLITRAPHVTQASPSPYGEESWRLESLRTPDDTPQSFGSRFTNVFNSAAANPATRRWAKGEISNFHYLMLVNTMAGRTFNDFTQYPVFPWVLADYTSEELDLTDPRSFRDLSKPMGCQHPSREAEFRERYHSFAEMGGDDAPPFHYGTHYSSAMIVTSYLIRLQPFVQSYLLLQGGNFDHADRLFYSIEKAWNSASKENMSDVRELTPEFFYLPEFLSNINEFDFGKKQGDNEQINNVLLPPWAKGDPQIFIAKHREALESPFVSKHLNKWIDLVFGYKQRGEAALEATNVFHHLSYQGAKDLDSIEDPLERRSTIGIIHNFGQTPHQVFQRAHPPREDLQSKHQRLDTAAESLIKLPFTLLESQERITSLIYSGKQDRLLCSGAFRLNIPPSHDRYMEWGFADGSVRFYDAGTRRLVGLFEHLHTTQLSHAIFADSHTLITSGNDSVVSIWTVASLPKHVELQPKTSLFGHKKPVTILSASRSTSTLLTADTAGDVYLWDLNREEFVRTLRDGKEGGNNGARLECARINNVTGTIVLCVGRSVLLYTLNGQLLLEQVVCHAEDDFVASCAWYEGVGNEWLERELLFTGHKWGVVNIWTKVVGPDGKWRLHLVKRLEHTEPPRDGVARSSAAVSCILPMAQAVYTGDEDGMVYEWDCVQRQ